MIENHLAKSGDQIFDFQGRQLASHHDPRGEGKIWAERRLSEGLHAEHLIVLGLGCGYHVQALGSLTNKKIFVIESSREVFEACQKIHSLDFSKFNARCFKGSEDIRGSEWIKEAISKSYQVLLHKPSMSAQVETFHVFWHWLLGRNWQALTWQWDVRFQSQLITQIHPILAQEQNRLSLKDLDTFIDKSSLRGQSKSWMILKALRELIV